MISKFLPGRGDGVALHETTRHRSFHRVRRGRRPPPSFAESLLVPPMMAKIPAGAFANRAAIPTPSQSFRLKHKN